MTLLVRTQRSEEHGRENRDHLREYLNHHKWTMRRNIEIKGTLCERTEGNEVHTIRNWRKGKPCYKMTKT